MPNGSYMILYDSPPEDFERGLRDWDGKMIKVGDEQWLEQFEDEGGYVPLKNTVINEIIAAEGGLPVTGPAQFRPLYMGAFAGFPFLVAIEVNLSAPAFAPVITDVTTGEITEVDIEVFGSRQD